MTKTQLRSRKNKIYEQLQKIYEMLEDAQSELENLREEAEETIDEIEPYDGADDLTPEQEERQEWFDETLVPLEEAYDYLDGIKDNIEYAQNCLEEID